MPGPSRSLAALTSASRRVGIALVVALSLGVVLLPSGASASTVQLKMRAVGPTTVSQGAPFTVSATVRNTSSSEVTVYVGFLLVSVDGGGQDVVAQIWQAVVPAQGRLTTQVALVSSQWFAEQGTFEVHGQIDGVDAAPPLSFEVSPPTVVVPVFQDVTAQAGVSTTVGPSNCGGWAAGAAWGDVDGDGDPDLFLPRGGDPAILWINDGAGHFTDEAAARGVADPSGVGMGAAFADYDNDGDQDLLVAGRGPERLFRNDGTGHFTDVSVSAGVAGTTDDVSVSWGDYDNDGFLDMYIVSNSQCAPPHFYQQDRLLHNEGDGTFTDQTALLSVAATYGAGYQAAWFDFDGDGDQDLYLANDRWGPTPDRNHFWRNDGSGPGDTWVFTEISAESGADYFINSMGIGISDIDRDLDLDFAISNIAGNVVARNNGDGTFTEVAAAVGLQRAIQSADVESVTWGLAFADFNLDRYEDMFAAAGSIYDEFNQPNQVFTAAGNGTFLDLSALSGADDSGIGRGVAFADYDRDGLMDVFVVNRNGSPVLYRNVTSASGHWLELRLTGTTSSRDACGARLILATGSDRQIRELFCGSVGGSTGNETVVHFGLGSASQADRIIITWPSGRRQTLRNVAGDQLLDVTEPA